MMYQKAVHQDIIPSLLVSLLLKINFISTASSSLQSSQINCFSSLQFSAFHFKILQVCWLKIILDFILSQYIVLVCITGIKSCLDGKKIDFLGLTRILGQEPTVKPSYSSLVELLNDNATSAMLSGTLENSIFWWLSTKSYNFSAGM